MLSKCRRDMDHGEYMSNKENVPPSINHITPTREHSHGNHGQLSLGRRILASTTDHNRRNNSPLNSARRLYKSKEHVDVHLKDGNGTVIGRGILETQIQLGNKVGGLNLFPHQCAVRILEVHATRLADRSEDGESMVDCIGQIIRWSKDSIQAIEGYSSNSPSLNEVARHFDFSEDGPSRFRSNEEQNSDFRSEDQDKGGNDSQNEHCPSMIQHICSVSGVDGLPQSSQKRKYVMVRRVSQERRPRKIGIARSEKVTLRNVQMDLQSRSCSKRCLEKLEASVVLMKRFKAWGSEKYEERASWILENLTDVYNVKMDKFETKLCGQCICNGCYAIALGYSRRRIEELKSNIRSRGIVSEIHDVQCNGRISAVHGNTSHVPRTSLGVQAMKTIFERFVKEAGCTQPHRQCRRRSNNEMVPLDYYP